MGRPVASFWKRPWAGSVWWMSRRARICPASADLRLSAKKVDGRARLWQYDVSAVFKRRWTVSDEAKDALEVSNGDIVFDCPHCGKSLAIDPRGAGLIIACPDCSQQVQVPGLPLEERAGGEAAEGTPEDALPAAHAAAGDPEDMAAALEASHTKIARLVESLEEVRERRRYLEQLRTANIARFKQIGKELETIQHAMDRIVAHLQDAAAENGVEG